MSQQGTRVGTVVRVYADRVFVAVSERELPRVGVRGRFLKIETRAGRTLIGMVTQLELQDELYRHARGRIDIIEQYEKLALSRNELVVSLIGTLNSDGTVERKIDIYPAPGDRVYVMSSEELRRLFGDGDVRIGVLNTDPSVEVRLNLNELATKHVAILAMTGSGKSNTLAVLLTRILKLFPYARILLIDTHSEYVNLAREDSPIKDKVTVYCPIEKFREMLRQQGIDARPLEIPYWLLTIEEWYSLLGLDARATKQRRILRTALRGLKRKLAGERVRLNDPVFFEVEALHVSISRMGRDSAVEDLLMKLEDALESDEYAFVLQPTQLIHLRSVKGDRAVVEYFLTELMLKPGLKIIALGGLSSDIQIAVVSMLLRTVFRLAVEAKLAGVPLPTIIAIEEAHLYAPQSHYPPSRHIIERIAKEGRKFGIGLIVISQRPRELSETVLAQCGTLIALRTVNPSDQRHIQNSMEDIMSALALSLPGLGTGEAIITGRAVKIPCIVKVDFFDDVIEQEFGRRIGLSGKDVDFRALWSREPDEKSFSEVLNRLFPILANAESQQKPEEERREEKRDAPITRFFGA